MRAGTMRTLLITGDFFPQIGGLQVYVEKLAASMAGLCNLGLITKEDQWFPGAEPIAHFPVRNIRGPKTPEEWMAAADEMLEIISRFKPDILHLASAGVAAYVDCLPRDTPVVATVHGNDLTAPWQEVPGRDPTVAIVEGLNACDYVFAVSEHTGALCEQW